MSWKNATFPQYVLVLVDLFSSKVYTYPMRSRKQIRQRLEQLYEEVESKRKKKVKKSSYKLTKNFKKLK